MTLEWHTNEERGDSHLSVQQERHRRPCCLLCTLAEEQPHLPRQHLMEASVLWQACQFACNPPHVCWCNADENATTMSDDRLWARLVVGYAHTCPMQGA
jgi:hypothetical protein